MVKKKNLSQHPAKRSTLSRRYACHCKSLQSREDFTRANTEGSPQGANKARKKKPSKESKPLLEKHSLVVVEERPPS